MFLISTSLGVFMRDITLCNEGTPKKLKNGLYNFSKLRTLVVMVGTVSDVIPYTNNRYLTVYIPLHAIIA